MAVKMQTPTAPAVPRGWLSTTVRRRVSTVLSYVLMAILGVLFMFPWFWTLTTSFKKPSELYIFPPLWIPESLRYENYGEVFNTVPFARWYLNSSVVVLLVTLGVLLSGTLVAYSFARFRWPGRDVLFAITLGTMMLPAQITLIPKYVLFKELGWLNTIKPLWIPAFFGGGAFAIFLLRQFIMSLPREFDEAAYIDGANPLQILQYILLPMMKPVLATVGVIHFIWAWNDFLDPLIYLTSPERYTLALGLRYFDVAGPAGNTMGVPTEHLLMASVVMSTTPIIILFFAAQKYFVQGIVMSGLKG